MARQMFTSLTPPPLTVAANNALVLALSATTIVNLTSTLGATIISLAAVGGNIDGMVVCFSNVNATALSFQFTHESLTEATPVNRFRNASAAPSSIVQFGAIWYRWSAISQRWQSIAKV